MHGGDIYHKPIEYDFSVNINPLGIADELRSTLLASIDKLDRYPEYDALSLRESIAESYAAYHGLSVENIVCGNGASELISALVNVIRPGRAIIAGPAFLGYERALKACDSDLIYNLAKKENGFVSDESLFLDIRKNKPELVFIANPSNPAGALLNREYLEKLIKECELVGAILLVDECFIELTDKRENSLLGTWLSENVCILRAFTKTYAIPGVRLGYMISANKNLLAKVMNILPEWNISIQASEAGMVALKLKGYVEEARNLIAGEREYLSDELLKLGYEVVESKANYVLFYINDDGRLYEYMLDKRILIRDCSDYLGLSVGYYRIAVKTHEENEVIIKALKAYLEKKDA